MKINKKELIIYTVLPYILLFLFSLYFYNKQDIEKLYSILFFGFYFLIIKDFLVYFFDFDSIKLYTLDKKLIKKDSLGIWEKFLIFNRRYLFPFFLVLYMIILLLNTVKLSFLTLKTSEIFKNILLGFVVLFGFFTVFKDNLEEKYKIEQKNIKHKYAFLFLILFLSGVGFYIIYTQTISLGILSYIISMISGILIFLLGITILEEDEKLN